MKKRNLIISLLLLCGVVFAQTPVGMAPPIHFQFFTGSGVPLANGKLFTYAAGTTNVLNTYTDATGTTQNPDPILLDASGAPANGSTSTGIFLANNSYKFVAYDSNNVFQWAVDNVATYFGLLNSANTWTVSQTFSLPIVERAQNNQFFIGSPGLQTTLDFPSASNPDHAALS
jgi:hypothetical protein